MLSVLGGKKRRLFSPMHLFFCGFFFLFFYSPFSFDISLSYRLQPRARLAIYRTKGQTSSRKPDGQRIPSRNIRALPSNYLQRTEDILPITPIIPLHRHNKTQATSCVTITIGTQVNRSSQGIVSCSYLASLSSPALLLSLQRIIPHYAPCLSA